MGQFSQVPGLAGYQQQVAFNDNQGAQQMMKLSQLMHMAQQQQAMQQAPEDRAMKQELQRAQMEQYRGNVAENQAQAQERQAAAQKMQRVFSLSKEISALPDGHPERAAKILEYKTLVDPKGAFEGPKTAPLPWYVKPGPDGKMQLDPAYSEFEKAKASLARPAQPYFNFLPTADGYAVGNARSGQITPAAINGQPVIKASDSPALQGRISQAKETGKTIGEETTKAALDAPRIAQNGETAIRLSNDLLKHPGFEQAVGGSSMLGIQKIPGTDAKDFTNRLDQIKGGAFLEAFNMLKGGGQITEVEGKKATDAIARMDIATSEPEFKQAVKDYQDVIKKGISRAKAKAAAGGGLKAGAVDSGFVYIGGDPAQPTSWKKATP